MGNARGLTSDGKEIKIRLTTFTVKPNNGAVIFVEEDDRNAIMGISTEHLLQDFLDTVPDMIYFKDLQNRFIMVNRAHASALHVTPEEVRGKTDLDFFPKEIAKRYYEDDSYVVKSGKPIVGKIEKAKRPDGGTTFVSTTKVPHYDETGRIIGTIGITHNITDKMIAEEELRAHKDTLEALVKERTKELKGSNERLLYLYKMKSEFTNMVSHELRTPVTAIKILVETLKKGKVKQEKLKEEYYNMILEESDRLTRLINDILDFAKLENKKMKFKIIHGDLNEVITQVVKSYEAAIRKKGLKLIVHLDHSVPLVAYDADRMTQVFHNVMHNALKFTEKGSISVESRSGQKDVKVIVKDTGYGIKTEDLARIFQKFEQGSHGTGPGNGGTGLGLAICKQIMEQQSGSISVRSTFGEGSQFSISLPVK
jgi:two-component system sensor histidine kinase/response regulator